jgi:hypothetical protein
MRKLPVNGKGMSGLLGSLPYCDDRELSGYVNGRQVFFEVGGKCESRAFDREVVFHSHPVGRFANVPSVDDVMKFAFLRRAKVSVIVCPDCFVVMVKGPRFDPDKYNPDFDAVSLLWKSGVDKRWVKNWKLAVENIGMKVDLYGRESA